MLRVADTGQRDAFEDTVRAILPILCFTPDEVDAFIAEYRPRADDGSHIVQSGDGQPTFCRYSIDGSEVFIDYILPSNWNNRYTLVKDAILRLRDEYLTPGSNRFLRMHVDERIPSHAAYFLGLLPELGFSLTPRVTMTAPQELMEELIPPALPDGVVGVSYQDELLPDVVDAYVRAFSGKMADQLPEAEWERLRQNEAQYLKGAFRHRKATETWTGLTHEEQLVGGSFGDVSGDRLQVEEVFVVPEQQGKGLGRYLTVRCMQKLHQQHGTPNSFFFLGTDRRWTPALNLYHSIGYAIDRVESYAFLSA